MTDVDEPLADVTPDDLVPRIRSAGVAGAGGAGFPAYAKWDRFDEVDAVMINHQESEPNFLKDRHLGREHADELAALIGWLLESGVSTVVIGTKEAYRGVWLGALEEQLDAAVLSPEELPIDVETAPSVVIACTPDRYEYGMESVLLREVTGVTIGSDLPLDHGWLVQNTESMYNIYRALAAERPVTRKLVHVDGDTPRHRFLDVPIGTPATDLLAQAGRPGGPGESEILADGGPGWSFEIEARPAEFGVRKRTNCLLIVDENLAAENTLGGGRINILGPQAWKSRTFETEPEQIVPDTVRIPLLTNERLEGLVTRSRPVVVPGERVEQGDLIAEPAQEGISNPQHASIDGEVAAVTRSHVTIERV
ncbi:NADH dehydrogenase [Halodesulfurarchaeum formicicum]|uniref:NADH dehydrogenase n=1 Tax=Halodesulfurarchaeum formicicum TaxID=1873524 RepID=UPI0008791B73|nr:NADH dehydrogenase [Halodesulfurarchaeum formicicum]